MKNKKAVFFPFTDYSFPLIEYLYKNKNEFLIASCKGTGLVGKDIAYSVNMPSVGLKVVNIHSICWNKISDLILLNPGLNVSLFTQIRNVYKSAINSNVNVIDLANIQNVNHQNIEIDVRTIDSINKPVIYVCGLFESVFNSLISLNIQYELSQMGIKTKIISYDENLKYVDAEIYDECFLKKPENLYMMQYKLYNQIKKVDENKSVDAIILQIPSGFTQINNHIFNGFGIYFSTLNNIVPPDYLILSIPFDFSEKEMVKEINNVSQTKYNKKIDAVVFNNSYYRFNEGITIGSQPRDVYLPFSLLDGLENNLNQYTIQYKKLVDNLVCILGEK